MVIACPAAEGLATISCYWWWEFSSFVGVRLCQALDSTVWGLLSYSGQNKQVNMSPGKHEAWNSLCIVALLQMTALKPPQWTDWWQRCCLCLCDADMANCLLSHPLLLEAVVCWWSLQAGVHVFLSLQVPRLQSAEGSGHLLEAASTCALPLLSSSSSSSCLWCVHVLPWWPKPTFLGLFSSKVTAANYCILIFL